MVKHQILARGVRDTRVLSAMAQVPRERFLPPPSKTMAYEDAPLSIGEGQTISQPYIVAFMIEALDLQPGERVLEIGAGSGYAAAVLAEIAGSVYTIERIATLAQTAASNLYGAGYTNVHVRHEDGTKGWLDEAPFDAILVSAGGPDIPESLKEQLAIGGRMVIPIGEDQTAQELVRVTRQSQEKYIREDLADVRFVPLIGEEGWENEGSDIAAGRPRIIQTQPRTSASLPSLITRYAEPFETVEDADLSGLIERIGDRRIVLLGEASHGTSEFYSMRRRITQELIEKKGFNTIAVETDWPDAARIDHYVRHRDVPPSDWEAFSRFPTWMWRNQEVHDFVEWLRDYNSQLPYIDRVGFYGLDLYSLHLSSRAIIAYLEDIDPKLAELAKRRYGCLTPWEADPAAYGRAALTGAYRDCASEVTDMLVTLYQKRREFAVNDGERLFDAQQNARLVANAERYYRIMYYGSRASWNLRDRHMFDTLQAIIKNRQSAAKVVIWAHNSHIGDASATEMSARGEFNLGELCRRGYGDQSYRIGFGTDHGFVAAASEWDGPMQIKKVRPAHPQSYENLFHQTGLAGLVLPMRPGHELGLVDELSAPRLQRAIGVIYRPETELASHYFEAELPRQFHEYIWIDETKAISPLETAQIEGMPETYPFGL